MNRPPRQKRDFLRVTDLSREELLDLLERAAEWKLLGSTGPRPLAGRSVGLVFEKASTRTRVSFAVGAYQLGANEITMSPRDMQLGRGEPIRDTARVLARYVDAVVVRTFEQAKLEEMARWADVPVVNALTDSSHPCQILADLQTVAERFGHDRLARGDLPVAYVGDGNNVANSWLEACIVLGFPLRIACPAGYEPDPDLVRRAGDRVRIVRSPEEAVRGAQVLNTDVWASMGQEAEAEERRRVFRDYILDRRLLARAAPDAMVLHCLPAHRGEEIEEEVLEGPQSAVFDEAENRLHAQKALLEFLLAPR
jgi:ornithine carbamoyltransferase